MTISVDNFEWTMYNLITYGSDSLLTPNVMINAMYEVGFTQGVSLKNVGFYLEVVRKFIV